MEIPLGSPAHAGKTTKCLCELLHVNPPLNRKNRKVELGHCQAESIKHSRLPLLRKSFLLEHRLQILNSSTEYRQHGRRAVHTLVCENLGRGGHQSVS